MGVKEIKKQLKLEIANIVFQEVKFLTKLLFFIEHDIGEEHIDKFINDYDFTNY